MAEQEADPQPPAAAPDGRAAEGSAAGDEKARAASDAAPRKEFKIKKGDREVDAFRFDAFTVADDLREQLRDAPLPAVPDEKLRPTGPVKVAGPEQPEPLDQKSLGRIEKTDGVWPPNESAEGEAAPASHTPDAAEAGPESPAASPGLLMGTPLQIAKWAEAAAVFRADPPAPRRKGVAKRPLSTAEQLVVSLALIAVVLAAGSLAFVVTRDRVLEATEASHGPAQPKATGEEAPSPAHGPETPRQSRNAPLPREQEQAQEHEQEPVAAQAEQGSTRIQPRRDTASEARPPVRAVPAERGEAAPAREPVLPRAIDTDASKPDNERSRVPGNPHGEDFKTPFVLQRKGQ
jgi:hypothetical protein